MLDVLIIGAGVVGCAIARELSRLQLKVAVYERGDDVCSGTSKANSAIIHSGHSAKPGSTMARMNVEGNAMYTEICEELDVPFKRIGSLNVAFAPEQLPGLEKLMADGIANGVPGMRIVDGDELHRMEPSLVPEACGALLAPSSGIICPYELTIALAENAAINGVAFYRSTAVKSIEKAGQCWRARLENGEVVETKTIVNAAGLYSDVFNNMVTQNKIKIIPRKGEYWMVDKEYAGAFKHTIFQLPGPMGKGILVSPTVDGTLILGPTAQDVDDPDDTGTSAAGLGNVSSTAARIWSSMPRNAFITTFAGLRAHLSSHDFVLGEPEDAPGFFNAAGIESPGLTSAPAIAKELSGQIASRLNAKPNMAYKPGRPPVLRFRELDNAARAAAIAVDAAYGRIVCRCETVTEGEVRDAIRRPVGARSIDAVKRRTRAGMGRCQGGFCMPRVLDILAEELHCSPLEITKCGGSSYILTGKLHEGMN